MVEELKTGPVNEQKICVKCGLCCDNTLFHHATLQQDEKGKLPEKIEQNYMKKGDQEFFILPCPYFDNKCTIYDRKRADICSAFRCQLLEDFASGEVTLQDALETVDEAIKIREELMEQYRKISGNNQKITFRKLLLELGKINKPGSEGKESDAAYGTLLARCNIFEALLVKKFRSADDFDRMVMK